MDDRREVGTARRRRQAVYLALLGIVVAAGYGLSTIELGGEALTSAEAWRRGVAQPYVLSGLLLVSLSIFLFHGATWPRWPIVLWCPLTVLGGKGWALSRGVGAFDLAEFAVLGAPVLLLWGWGTHRALFTRSDST